MSLPGSPPKGATQRGSFFGPGTCLCHHRSMPSHTDERLTALEIKASYSEDLLDQLNMTIYRQQQQIDRLGLELSELRRRVPEAGGDTPRSARDEIPPHY